MSECEASERLPNLSNVKSTLEKWENIDIGTHAGAHT